MATDLGSVLRGRGLRSTPGRRAVLRLIEAGEVPLSHGDIMQRLQRTVADRATVFRILDDLVRVGLARRMDVGDRVWRYGPGRDSNRPMVAVFVCSSCHRIDPLEVELTVRTSVPRALREKQVQLLLRGRCDACG